jgi:hypothetical protein
MFTKGLKNECIVAELSWLFMDNPKAEQELHLKNKSNVFTKLIFDTAFRTYVLVNVFFFLLKTVKYIFLKV